MSGSAPRFSRVFACIRCAQHLHEFWHLMDIGNPGRAAVLVLFAPGFSNFDGYGKSCTIPRTAASLHGQAAKFYNETRPRAVILLPCPIRRKLNLFEW